MSDTWEPQEPRVPPVTRYIWEAYSVDMTPPPGVVEPGALWTRDSEHWRELAFLDMVVRQFECWTPARRRRVLEYINARYPEEPDKGG